MSLSRLAGCVALTAVTAFLYWLPRSDNFVRRREQRRAMMAFPISAETFTRLERFNSWLLPLVALIAAIAMWAKLIADAT